VPLDGLAISLLDWPAVVSVVRMFHKCGREIEERITRICDPEDLRS
jgi:hypothetical protein